MYIGNNAIQMEFMLDTIQQGGALGQFTVGQYEELYKALRDNRKTVANGQLMKALAKSGVGYPTQAQDATSATGSELAPLVPQSLDPILVSSTFTQKQVRFYNMLAKPTIYNTVHEAVRLDQEGLDDDVPGWFTEGGAPSTFEETYSKVVQQVKFFGRKFKLTDVARMVGIVGFQGLIKRGTLQFKTSQALLGLGGQLERELFWGDSALYSGAGAGELAWDGLYKQTVGNDVSASDWYNSGLPYRAVDGSNYKDMRGQSLDHAELIQQAGNMQADPIFATPNVLMVGPKQYAQMHTQALAYQRNMNIGGGATFQFGPTGELVFTGSEAGAIPIKSFPLMPHKQTARSVASSTTAPDISGLSPSGTTPAGSADSQFESSDAGDYIYQIVPVGDGGKGAALNVGPLTVAAGDKVQIDMIDAAKQGAGDDKVRYYEVYRSAKDGAASTCKFIWRYPTNTDGGSSSTRIVDENYHLPGTSPAYLLEFGQNTVYMPCLLPITRRPLPSENTTTVALLMTFCTFFVRRPSRIFVFDNVLEG